MHVCACVVVSVCMRVCKYMQSCIYVRACKMLCRGYVPALYHVFLYEPYVFGACSLCMVTDLEHVCCDGY